MKFASIICAFALASAAIATPAAATTYVSGTYNSDQAWTVAGSPYVITSSLTINAGKTLTIEPGVIVKFGAANSLDALYVNGTIMSQGTATNHVTFTSIEDDTIGGDTGADGPSVGTPGQWYMIRVVGTASFLYTDVRYGGYGSSDVNYGAINVSGAATLDYTSVRYSQHSGVTANTCTSVRVSRSELSLNRYGISVFACPLTVDNGTKLSSNLDTGAFINNLSSYAGVPTSFVDTSIENNGEYGVRLQVAVGTPTASKPYGHRNNITGNGANADMRQVTSVYEVPDSDWTNNYWGEIQEAVPCGWATASSYPYHLSYESPNPYSQPPKRGPVNYTTYTRVANGVIEKCGSDKVADNPWASSRFDTEALVAPRLTLFLDRNGTFDPAHPSSDLNGFIPGSDTNGISMAIPAAGMPIQSIYIIATYVDALGSVVPPPYADPVTFQLSQTSKFAGIAMNAPDSRGDDTLPDFTVRAGDGDPPDYSSASTQVSFQGSVARAVLDCWDFGGFTAIQANDTHSAALSLRAPLDVDGNWIPDTGWKATANGVVIATIGDTHAASFAWDDQDTIPNGTGVLGDGLVNYEEYRGFVVRSEHRRTNPYQRDLFVDSNLPTNIGYANNLSLTKHWVAPEQLGAATYLINPNFSNTGYGGNIQSHSAQRGVRVREGGWVADSRYGQTPPGCVEGSCTPNYQPAPNTQVSPVLIFSDAVRGDSPTTHTYSDPDPPDDEAVRQATGHEIGHMVNMRHYSYAGDGRITPMISGFFPWADSTWSNIDNASQYDTNDNQWIQVR